MITNNHTTDTIAAIATPSGRGGIAIIRVSGPDSARILDALFRGSTSPVRQPHSLVYGHAVENDAVLDETLAVYMPAPHSYTAEDVAEIHTHGGRAAVEAVLDAVYHAGARPAEPGEFTRRAFLNGRIDLVQAESVMEIVEAESNAHLRSAEQLMDGEFSSTITAILDNLLSLRADAEASIDFHDSDDAVVSSDSFMARLAEAHDKIDRLCATAAIGRRMRDGVTVVISGIVNAGKSSLFNTLIGRKRSIVNTRPGTTRDWVEERLVIDGIPLTLIDTAGIRETVDEIEREGVDKSHRLIALADIVLRLHPPGETAEDLFPHLPDTVTIIDIISKADIEGSRPHISDSVPVSSTTRSGIDDLRHRIFLAAKNLLVTSSNGTVILVDRHHRELSAARDALERSRHSVAHWGDDIVSMELREAINHLERLLGTAVDTDILDRIFSRFCVGK